MNEEVQSLAQEFSTHREKTKAAYTKIEGCLDKMVEFYEQAQLELAEGRDGKQIIDALNRHLMQLKPIKSVRDHFLHYYRKLSNLVKKVQTKQSRNGFASPKVSRKRGSQISAPSKETQTLEQKFNEFFNGFLCEAEQRQHLKKMIVQYFLREGRWEESGTWEGMEIQIDPNQLFRECFGLKEGVRRGQMQDAIRWCETEKIFETYEILLQYELKKMYVLRLVEKQQLQAAIQYYSNNMAKFYSHKHEEIQRLILYILVRSDPTWSQQLPQQIIQKRYEIFQFSEEKCIKLSQEFEKEYLRHNNLSQFNALKIIYDCSERVQGEYKRLMGLMWQSEAQKGEHKKHQTLPFSVTLPKQNQYHSLFLCPITKQVHSGGQCSMLLSCGHLISESAHTRIVQQSRNRRKVKCPICLKEIRPDESKKAQF